MRFIVVIGSVNCISLVIQVGIIFATGCGRELEHDFVRRGALSGAGKLVLYLQTCPFDLLITHILHVNCIKVYIVIT